MTVQLQAGYLIESLKEALLSKYGENADSISKLLTSLSYFELISNIPFPELPSPIDPTLAVANNIISRGLPTRMSFSLEKKFIETFNYFESYEELGTLKNKLTAEHLIEFLYRALHIIEPRLNRDNILKEYENSWERLDSDFEEDFLYKELPERINNNSGDYFIQLMETQRQLNELLKLKEIPPAFRDGFVNQRVDFSLELPYSDHNDEIKGYIIEIDGIQHEEQSQRELDNERNNKANELSWKTIRIKTSEWNILHEKLYPLNEQLSDSEYIQRTLQNFCEPLFVKEEGLMALQLILSPIAIARIQKSLIELLIRRSINLEDDEWNIAIIEKDVPCANLAILDFKQLLENLYRLQDRKIKLPEIHLDVFTSEEFYFAKLNESISNELKLIDEIEQTNKHYNIVLDVSVLQRAGLSQPYRFPDPPDNYITIRSVHSIKSKRTAYTSARIKYREITKRINNDEFEAIEECESLLIYFLQGIFRKRTFRLGQLPILNRALQLESVIGLLPTGGGKSLTYQLASLLQPGITLIIDPIKSLMKDQVDGLNKNYIDTTVFINSSLKTPEERKRATLKMVTGEALFSFVSPERLQIQEFRESLKSMRMSGVYFSYVVIDEAHCVSEWGHDFRTSYLSLGKNAIKFCGAIDETPVSLFGLTATASFDVLADVQRELADGVTSEMLSDEALVRFETTNRMELQYEIIKVEITDDELESSASKNDFEIKKALGKKKQNELYKALIVIHDRLRNYNENYELVIPDSIENQEEGTEIYDQIKLDDNQLNNFFNASCSSAGLVFCPHRSWVFGVTDNYKNANRNLGVFDNLPTDNGLIAGTFMGADSDDQNLMRKIDDDNIANQDSFINNKKNLLICTKAFGMGIDKANIRFSYHINYPSSIEGYVQEAGRIGRDGKLALSTILFNDQQITDGNESIDKSILLDFYNNSFKGPGKEKWILYEMLTEISYSKLINVIKLKVYLNEMFDKNLQVNLWQNSRLYISESFTNSAGYILLPDLGINIDPAFDTALATSILNSAAEYINTNKTEEIDIIDWLNFKSSIGLERILDDLEIDEPFQFILGFENNSDSIYESISNFLQSHLGITCTRITVKNAMERTIDFSGFINELEKIHKRNNNQSINILELLVDKALEDGKEEDFYVNILENRFYKHRTKSDTEKALYRLATIGVIDDYTVDFRTSVFTATGIKKSEDQYKSHIREYVGKYYSQIRTTDIIDNIDNRKGNNIIHKGLNFLIEFIYKEIARKRYLAIGAMRDACVIGLEEGNLAIKEFIDLYFNSKYARQDYYLFNPETGVEENCSLTDITNSALEQNIEWVWKFINITTKFDTTGSQLENLKHLRGAAVRLLISNPENATLLLLKSFAVFVLEENRIETSRLVKEAITDFYKGFSIFQDTDLQNQKSFLSAINKYKSLLEANTHIDIAKIIEETLELLKLRAHRLWLQNFNNKFLVDYERTNQ